MNARPDDPGRWDVFISYSRADDEPFVRRLYRDLSTGKDDASVSVWWDRECMESRGRTFVQEIYRAIERSDRVLAVVSPRSVESTYVTAEWEHARMFAKAVVPILRGDPSLRPLELTRLHYLDFRDERQYEDALAQLRRLLSAKIEELAAPLTSMPALPPHFLLRSADIALVGETVLAGSDRLFPHDTRTPITALRGMPGAGKTTIAAAFALSTPARKAFRYIAWVTVGQTPNLLESLRSIGTALGDSDLHYASEASAANRLQTMLEGRHCLIVLDDVWEMSHATLFSNAMDATNRLLITTREGALVTALGAKECPTAELESAEAIRLLASWAGDRMLESDLEDVSRVAIACGYLPLPLSLCGALVRDGNTWPDLVKALANVDVQFIDRRLPNYPYSNVLRAVEVSVEHLRREDVEAARRFNELVIFSAVEAVPESAIVTLWSRVREVPEYRARGLLVKLGRKELIRIDGDAPNRRISMHALVRDYLRVVAHDPHLIHAELLRAYNPANRDWNAVPDDGYIHAHLTSHMEAAGRADDIEALLTETCPDGSNARYQALERFGGTPTFIADFTRAWRIARDLNRKNAGEGEPAQHLATEIRYALCLSSVYNISARVPAALLAISLDCGARTWKQVRSLAEMHTDPLDRARALVRIAPRFPPAFRGDMLRSAVTAARSVDAPLEKLEILTTAARSSDLPADLADGMIQEVSRGYWMVEADFLAALAPRLSGTAVEKALEIAKAFDPAVRARATSALLARLPEDEWEARLSKLIADVKAMSPRHELVLALCELIPVRPDAADEALLVAEQLVSDEANWSVNGTMLAALARSIPNDRLHRFVSLLSTAEVNDTEKACAISAVGPRFPETATPEVARFYAATKRSKLGDHLGLLALVAYYLPEPERTVAIAASVKKLVSLAGRHNGLSLDDLKRRAAVSLLPRIPDALLDAAIDAARRIANDEQRAEVLAALLPRCSEAQQRQVVDAELRRVTAIGDDEYRAAALAALVPHLDLGQRARIAEEALVAATSAPIVTRCQLASALAPHLKTARRQRILGSLLSHAIEIKEDFSLDSALAALTRHVDDSGFEQIRRFADAHHEKTYGTRAAVIRRLPAHDRVGAIEAILAAPGWLPVEVPDQFVSWIQEIAEFMDDDQVTKALDITERIRESFRPVAWAALVSRLSSGAVAQLHRKARLLRGESARALALCVVSPRLPERARAKALVQALEAAVADKDVDHRIRALRTLIPYVKAADYAPVLTRTLTDIRAIADDGKRAKALSAFIAISELSTVDRRAAFEEMLESSLGQTVTSIVGSRTFRTSLRRSFLLQRLAECAAALAELGGPHLVAATVVAIREPAGWWP